MRRNYEAPHYLFSCSLLPFPVLYYSFCLEVLPRNELYDKGHVITLHAKTGMKISWKPSGWEPEKEMGE
jgi:hypothetical protein